MAARQHRLRAISQIDIWDHPRWKLTSMCGRLWRNNTFDCYFYPQDRKHPHPKCLDHRPSPSFSLAVASQALTSCASPVASSGEKQRVYRSPTSVEAWWEVALHRLLTSINADCSSSTPHYPRRPSIMRAIHLPRCPQTNHGSWRGCVLKRCEHDEEHHRGPPPPTPTPSNFQHHPLLPRIRIHGRIYVWIFMPETCIAEGKRRARGIGDGRRRSIPES
jgi:hypothetical protein